MIGIWAFPVKLPSGECHNTSLINFGSGNDVVPSGNKNFFNHKSGKPGLQYCISEKIVKFLLSGYL